MPGPYFYVALAILLGVTGLFAAGGALIVGLLFGAKLAYVGLFAVFAAFPLAQPLGYWAAEKDSK